MWGAKAPAWEKTSACAARKHSSSTYKDKSSTLIRRSSTLKRITPLGNHHCNRKDEDSSASDPAYIEEAAEPQLIPWYPRTGRLTCEIEKIPQIVLATWTHWQTIHRTATFLKDSLQHWWAQKDCRGHAIISWTLMWHPVLQLVQEKLKISQTKQKGYAIIPFSRIYVTLIWSYQQKRLCSVV